MAIHFTPGAPEATASKLAGWVPEIRMMATNNKAGGAPLGLSEGFAVRYLSAERLLAGELSESVNANRWRHLVMSGDSAFGELELDEANEPLALHEGMGGEGLLAAMRVAEGLDGDYEASVVMAPALRFVGLWLRGGAGDRVVPYPPNATRLPNYEALSLDQVLEVLRPLAEEAVYQSRAGEPTGG